MIFRATARPYTLNIGPIHSNFTSFQRVLVVIEVFDTSVEYDRNVKSLYARAVLSRLLIRLIHDRVYSNRRTGVSEGPASEGAGMVSHTVPDSSSG